ncbi:MAG: ABC transporter ATP-binding protein [Bacillaceae bacterium]
MLKIMKYTRPYIGSVIAIIMLLLVQAVSDLSLPDYMSNIVNVGIQQSGVENAVPKAIRETELEKITYFMDDKDKKEVLDHYDLIKKGEVSNKEYEKLVDKYPLLRDEPLYVLQTKNKKEIEKLNLIFAEPVLLLEGLKKEGPANLNPTQIPPEQVAKIKEQADKQFKELPESLTTQAAVSYVQREYKTLGVDLDNLQTKYVLTEGAKMLLIAFVSMGATIVVALLGAKVAAGMGRKIRGDVFKRVESFSNTEFDKFSTASLITRTTNDIQQIQMLMIMLLRIVFYAPILGIGGVIKVLNTETSMGWTIAVAVVAVLSVVVIMFGMAIPKFKLVQKLVDKLNLVTRESLTGMLVIRAFNTQRYEEQKFEDVNRDFTKTNLFINRIMTMMMPIMMLIMNAVTVLIVWVGAHQIDDGFIQVGDMMAFMQYAMQIVMSFLMISFVSIMLPRASVSAQRISEVLDTTPSINDPEKPVQFDDKIHGVVEFKDVSFRYPGAEDDVLHDITFTAKPGETTAFIGSTGSGKSTLINLIPRFYDVTEGAITINGVDIRQVSQKDLRDKIGYVPQKGVLFTGTIESNLKYGDENASDKVLEKSAEIAQAMEFINGKPDRFQTEIAQGGTNVSGGQKQRLSIARALVKQPDVYIFDDSFSALDYKTDAVLRAALKAETENATVLIVAQRISTIMNADQIIVLDEGKIVGKGTHKELLQHCEVYREIAMSQLSGEELSS